MENNIVGKDGQAANGGSEAGRLSEYSQAMSREHEALKERQVRLVERVKALSVVRVEADYDGCGDSGDVQAVRAIEKGGKTVGLKGESVTVERFESVYDDETKGWRREPSQSVVGLEQALGDFAVDFLSFLGIDWYNNEGGYGTVVLNVEDGEVVAEHNERVESSEYSEHAL